MNHDTVSYPFTAVVGMDDLSLALCLAVVSPAIGGVLVRGEKGTAKSTMVRGLASVLPPVSVVEGCRFSCDPLAPDPGCPDAPHPSVTAGAGAAVERPVRLVELPVGASEDRLVGSLHLDRLVSTGRVTFDPGLLARAHRGILYVDEVNLLPDHLVDTLLDAAAMGRARIERESVSVTHAARFVLVGTMNPEEGDLRPQLLDRFGLTVEVAADRDPAARVQVVRRRLAYEADPRAFAADYADSDEALARRLSDARDGVGSVDLPDSAVVSIASLCAAYDLDGLRGDLVVARCAVAHAAWCGRDVVSNDDIRVAARLALPHRRRRNPFDSTDPSARGLDDLLDEMVPATPPAPPEGPEPPGTPDPEADGPVGGPAPEGETEPEGETPPGSSDSSDGSPQRAPGRGADTQGEPAGTPYAAHLLRLDRAGRGVVGRRSAAITAVGRHVRPVGLDDARGQGLSLMGTVLAAAARTAGSRHGGDGPAELGRIALSVTDLRRSLRHGKEGNLVVFAVDTSGSMGAARRVREVKTAVVSLLLDAYQRRDKVAVLTFGGRSAQVVLPPTSSVELAERLLTRVATGGRTPLAEGIAAAADLVRRERARDPHRRALVLLMTDGRANAGPDGLARALHAAAEASRRDGEWVVVDCEDPRAVVRLGLARTMAGALGARCLELDDLAAHTLVRAVRAVTNDHPQRGVA